ncbi:hypothetical protein CcaverHIS002_0212920 [Cutaneotrichosporon cavernicola]|nr:hypothetical protein CcaverHIS002_0212920 [Cutaneotrichosporon cavernicola]
MRRTTRPDCNRLATVLSVDWHLVLGEHRDPELLTPQRRRPPSPSIKPWAAPLISGWIIRRMPPEMESRPYDDLGQWLAQCPKACAADMLPITRHTAGDGVLPTRPARTSYGENDSIHSATKDSGRTYDALMHDLVGMFPTLDGVEVHPHFDAKMDHLAGDGREPVHLAGDVREPVHLAGDVPEPVPKAMMRPDFVTYVSFWAAFVRRILAIVEFKSLTAAPDAAFDALDEMALAQRFVFVPSASDPGKVVVKLQSCVRDPKTRIGADTYAEVNMSHALHVAATNIADVAGYCLQGSSLGGLWSSLIRHAPLLLDLRTRTIFFGTSRGHRLRDGPGSLAVTPTPSLPFPHAAVGLQVLQYINDELTAAGTDQLDELDDEDDMDQQPLDTADIAIARPV